MTVSILLRKKYFYKTGSAFRVTFVYILIKKVCGYNYFISV
jgi:adenine C2-methylase RlmN of 23S rRNA A2503 and tRNA A37